MAFNRISVRVVARYIEQMGDNLGRLAHVQFNDRIGEPAFQPDYGLEEIEAKVSKGGEPLQRRLCPVQGAKPFGGALGKDQRSVAQRLRAARQNKIAYTVLHIAIGCLDG